MQRINWIDWVKAWCMTVVVFDHTPHDGSPFLLQFLAGTNLASFFFISGYLKKIFWILGNYGPGGLIRFLKGKLGKG